MSVTVTPTYWKTIIEAFKTQLVAYYAGKIYPLGAPNPLPGADSVKISQEEPTPPLTKGDMLVFLITGEEWPLLPEGSGGARMDMRMVRRRLTTRLFSRCGLDAVGEDTDWMEDALVGHLWFQDFTIDAMAWTQLADNGNVATGNILTHEPISYLSCSKPQRYARDKASGWGFSDVLFEIVYIRTMTFSTAAFPTSNYP